MTAPRPTLLVSHSAGLAHDMGTGHPERPERFQAVRTALDDARFAGLERREAPEANRDALILAHAPAYVDALLAVDVPPGRLVPIDGDTALSPGTVEAARRGAGGAVLAVDEVLAGRCRNAFVAMRPPGHHAETSAAMGFCFFNSAAVAARHAARRHGLQRVAIVDFDVHHGNGTQDIFWSDPAAMYCSTHQMPLFPGTGAAEERGTHDQIVNVPLRPGDGSEAFRAAFTTVILPKVVAFAPDLVVVSAGFDGHRADPLGQLRLDEDDFAWVTAELVRVAERCAEGRLVSVLEGGYDLQALAASTSAHVAVLAGLNSR